MHDGKALLSCLPQQCLCMSKNVIMSTGRHGNRKVDSSYTLYPKLTELPVRLQECEEAQRCIAMVLRCLVKGLCREGEGAGRLSAVIADWLLQSHTALSIASRPEEWAKFLKVDPRPYDAIQAGESETQFHAESRLAMEPQA